MGFGLYSTSLLARDAGLRFEVRSGGNTLLVQNGVETTIESDFWQGMIVYLQLHTNREIDPAEVVANRTNITKIRLLMPKIIGMLAKIKIAIKRRMLQLIHLMKE